MDKLANLLYNTPNVVKRGSFTLSSGAKNDFYIDVKAAYGYPNARKMIKERLWKIMPRDVTCVAGGGVGGEILATMMADEHNLRLTLVRPDRKTYGMQNIIEGYKPTPEDRVAIVDDVVTTGGSLKRVINVVDEKAHINIRGCYVVVKREESVDLGYELKWVLTADQILSIR